jgi:hypothetical protein
VRSIRWLIACWGLLAGASLPGSATAAEMPRPAGSIDLAWNAPAECPTEADVEREILRLLAQSKHRETTRLQIVIQRVPSGTYQLQLTLLAPVTGTRTLSHSNCSSAARAAALIVAMAIDADAVALSDTSSATLDVTPNSTTSTVTAAAPSPTAPSPTTRAFTPPAPQSSAPAPMPRPEASLGRLRFQFNLGAQVESTFTPTFALGAVLGAGVESTWLRIFAALAAVPGSTRRVPSGAPQIGDVGARFSVGSVELAVCGGRFQQSLNLALCGGIREHWIRATGRGVDEVLTPVTMAPALTIGPVLSVPVLGPFGIEANVQAVVPLSRPRFVVDDLDALIFQPARVGVGGALSLTLGF